DKMHTHLVVTDDYFEASKHVKGMTEEMVATPADSLDTLDVDLTEEFDQKTTKVQNYTTRLFRPHADLAKRYVESWENGSQKELLGRMVSSLWNGVPLTLAWECKNKWEEWIFKRER
ncbi:hypothetical protein HK104_004265, partial [Borealophlyctis nickersoniae]